MELLVEGRGTFLSKHQGRLRITREQKMITEAPLIHLDQVLIIDSGVAISSDVIRVCAEEGIPIHFVSSRGSAYATLYSAGLTGTVLTRRAQLLAYESAAGVALAKAFVQGKLVIRGDRPQAVHLLPAYRLLSLLPTESKTRNLPDGGGHSSSHGRRES